MAFDMAPAITAMALLVGACGVEGGRLDVTGKADDLRFALVGENGAKPCIDRFTVAPVADPDGPPAWRVVAADPMTCTTGLRYGEPGKAFGQEAGPAPLRPGVLYRARVSGAGFSVVRDFSVTAEGVRLAPIPR